MSGVDHNMGVTAGDAVDPDGGLSVACGLAATDQRSPSLCACVRLLASADCCLACLRLSPCPPIGGHGAPALLLHQELHAAGDGGSSGSLRTTSCGGRGCIWPAIKVIASIRHKSHVLGAVFVRAMPAVLGSVGWRLLCSPGAVWLCCVQDLCGGEGRTNAANLLPFPHTESSDALPFFPSRPVTNSDTTSTRAASKNYTSFTEQQLRKKRSHSL